MVDRLPVRLRPAPQHVVGQRRSDVACSTRAPTCSTSSASQQVLVGERDEQLVTVVVSHPVSAEHEQRVPRLAAAGDRGRAAVPRVPWQRAVPPGARRAGGLDRGVPLRVGGGPQPLARVARTRASCSCKRSSSRTSNCTRSRTPFGSWFSFGGDGEIAVSTPAWKSALSVLVGLYPTVVLLTLAISRLWPDAELWASLLLGNILSVSLLTWVVMPNVTRALRFWLVESPTRSAGPRQRDRCRWCRSDSSPSPRSCSGS